MKQQKRCLETNSDDFLHDLFHCFRIGDRSRTYFDGAKMKLAGYFDRKPMDRYFEPCSEPSPPRVNITLISLILIPFQIVLGLKYSATHQVRIFPVQEDT